MYMCVHEGVNERGRLFWEPVGFWSPKTSLLSLHAEPETKAAATRPHFRFPPSLGRTVARPPASCRESPKSPGRSAVLPGAGRVGRRSLAGIYARWPRGPRSPLRRDGHDLEAAAAAVATCPASVPDGEGPGPGARLPRRRPGRGGGGPARGGAEPRAESAVTLARQVGGGGAGSAGGRWAARVGAL